MKIVVEFYRTRDADDAHAVVGRETVEVDDLDGAIAAARLLAQTLDMPQRPDSAPRLHDDYRRERQNALLRHHRLGSGERRKAITLNTHIKETERKQIAAAISVWENEGGAPGQDSIHHQYGRRIEADRYHVFTRIPARFGGEAMTGLSRLDSTSGMLRLNRRNAERRRERIELSSFNTIPRPAECGS